MGQSTCDIIIATRNRPAALRRCLDGLRDQDHTDFGVIVVDDASEPPVSDWITSDHTSDLRIEMCRLSTQSGPAAARNAGVAASSAELVLFIDDDVRPDRRLVGVHVRSVTAGGEADPRVASMGPFVQPADWSPTPWNLWEAKQAKHEADSLSRGLYAPTWRQFHTGNNCLTRETFLEAGGFDESFKRSEDDEFGLRLHRLGCSFVFKEDAIAWHYSERSREAWLAIPSAYAHFDARIDRMYPTEGYLSVIQREMRERHPLLRLARRTARGARRRRIAVTGAMVLATALYRSRLTQPSMSLLSAAYDLVYVGALNDETSTPL